MAANGNVSLKNSGTVVNGNATATGSINVTSITGTKSPNGAAITFPAINTANYQSVAVQTYNGDQTFSGNFTLPPPSNGVYPVIVVNGNLTLGAGTITGIGTIVVTGTLTFTGNRSYLYSSDKVAVLVGGQSSTAPRPRRPSASWAFCTRTTVAAPRRSSSPTLRR